MTQKNSVLKKSVAIMLSASLATSMAMAAKPQSRNSQSDSTDSIVICAVKGLLGLSIAGVIATTAWVELFANKILSVAEKLAKEFKSDHPNTIQIKKLSMTFAELLHQSTATSETTYSTQGHEFGQSDYNYVNTDNCKENIVDLIEKKLSEGDDEQHKQDRLKVRVNRLRKVDRERLKQKLLEMFRANKEKETNKEISINQNDDSETSHPSSSEEDANKQPIYEIPPVKMVYNQIADPSPEDSEKNRTSDSSEASEKQTHNNSNSDAE